VTQSIEQELESKVRFALEHPAVRADRETLARLLGAPDEKRQIIDSWRGGERVVLAILREGDGGAAGASQLLILGCRTPPDVAAFSAFLDEAEGRVEPGDREGGRALDVVLPPPLGCLRELLKTRGYSNVDTYFTLVAEVPSALESIDDAWRDVDASNVDAAVACHRDAFLEAGEHVASPEEARAVLLQVVEPALRPRVLFAEGVVAAVLRGVWLDEALGAMELRFLCRNPRFRGQRLGDRALAEAFRVTRRMGAWSVQLSVASTNRSALELYDRWGFRRVDQEEVLRVVLGATRSRT
jgi:ribosomal protein S18 acetylase RimI-like enzyme